MMTRTKLKWQRCAEKDTWELLRMPYSWTGALSSSSFSLWYDGQNFPHTCFLHIKIHNTTIKFYQCHLNWIMIQLWEEHRHTYHEMWRWPILDCSISLTFFFIASLRSLTVGKFMSATSTHNQIQTKRCSLISSTVVYTDRVITNSNCTPSTR